MKVCLYCGRSTAETEHARPARYVHARNITVVTDTTTQTQNCQKYHFHCNSLIFVTNNYSCSVIQWSDQIHRNHGEKASFIITSFLLIIAILKQRNSAVSPPACYPVQINAEQGWNICIFAEQSNFNTGFYNFNECWKLIINYDHWPHITL